MWSSWIHHDIIILSMVFSTTVHLLIKLQLTKRCLFFINRNILGLSGRLLSLEGVNKTFISWVELSPVSTSSAFFVVCETTYCNKLTKVAGDCRCHYDKTVMGLHSCKNVLLEHGEWYKKTVFLLWILTFSTTHRIAPAWHRPMCIYFVLWNHRGENLPQPVFCLNNGVSHYFSLPKLKQRYKDNWESKWLHNNF